MTNTGTAEAAPVLWQWRRRRQSLDQKDIKESLLTSYTPLISLYAQIPIVVEKGKGLSFAFTQPSFDPMVCSAQAWRLHGE